MGFTLLPGAPGRVHIHLGCRFGVLGTIPQGASIRAAFLVATVAGINIWTKRDFTLAAVELLEDPFPIRAFGQVFRLRLFHRVGIICFTAARCPCTIRIASRRPFSIFHIFRIRGRWLFLFGLSAPSGGLLFAAVSRFRCGGSRGIAAMFHGSCGLLIGFLVDFTEGFIHPFGKGGCGRKEKFPRCSNLAEKSCPSQLGFGSSTVVQYSPSIGRVYPCPTCLVHPF